MAHFRSNVSGGIPAGVRTLPTVDTATGSIATFNTDLTENLVSVKCQIVAKQASGTPSPSNPLPITTYTEMNVSATGKNLIDQNKYYQLNANIVVIGQTVSNANRLVYLRQGTYTIKVETSNQATIYYDYGNGSTSLGNTSDKRTFTLADDSYCAFWLYKSGGYSPSDITTIQLEQGNEATTYEPYNGTTKNIPFGQNVANGVLNITTGKLRVTWVEVDLGTLSWTRKTDGAIPYFRHDFTDSSLTQLNRAFACSDYPNVPFSNIYTNGQDKASASYSGGIFIISDTDYSDATAFTTAMNGVQLIYELATPIEIQLDSITLQALLNENNIWCDTGDTEVKYMLTVGKKIS